MALTPWSSQLCSWSWVRHRDTKCFCKGPLCVCHHCHYGALNALVLAPCHHYSAIIAAVDNHFSDALSFQLSFFVQVAWNLLSGSSWCESTRQTNQDCSLAPGALCNIHFIGREATINFH